MAIHSSISEMVKEALIEKYLVSKYCIEYRKDPLIWGSYGCYGYPAAVLLLSIADTVGSYVIGSTSMSKHFQILNRKDYYNLGLNENELKTIVSNYRNPLTHNSAMPMGIVLAIGDESDEVISPHSGVLFFNLLPFLNVTSNVLASFLPQAESLVTNSTVFEDLMKKK